MMLILFKWLLSFSFSFVVCMGLDHMFKDNSEKKENYTRRIIIVVLGLFSVVGWIVTIFLIIWTF